MDYAVRGTPEGTLEVATRFLLARGYQVERSTATTVTLSRGPKIDKEMGCMIIVLAIPTFGLSLLAVLLLNKIRWETTVAAFPAEGGLTRVSASHTVCRWSETTWRRGSSTWGRAPWRGSAGRELSRLSDGGHITPEEHKAKKGELLDRMQARRGRAVNNKVLIGCSAPFVLGLLLVVVVV